MSLTNLERDLTEALQWALRQISLPQSYFSGHPAHSGYDKARAVYERASAQEFRESGVARALREAECCLEQMCIGQHPENECWNVLTNVRRAINEMR